MEADREKEWQDQYSRVIWGIGVEPLKALQTSSILLVGLGAVGVEIAKNLVRLGVNHLTLYDSCRVGPNGNSPLLRNSIPNTCGAEAAAKMLRDLATSRSQSIAVLHEPVSFDAITRYKAVCATGDSLSDFINLNDWCRQAAVPFICGDSMGAFCWSFYDLGVAATVQTRQGEFFVPTRVSNANQAKVGVDAPVPFIQEGDAIEFSGVTGMSEIEGKECIVTECISPYAFRVDLDTTKFQAWLRGVAKLLPSSEIIHHRTFEEVLRNPKEASTDRVHLQFLTGFFSYIRRHSRAPTAWNNLDAHALVKLASSAPTEPELLRLVELAKTAAGGLPPLCSIAGGLATNNVISALARVATNRPQLMCYDAISLLPSMGVEEADAAPQSTPDDEIAAVLGRTLLHALRSKKLLLVGAGGIGCEILKDLLSMGIGKITVADNQKLSPVNLPGQFLYQPTDVNVPKPLAAVSSIRKYWGEATVDTCLDKNFSLQICEKHDIILSGVHSSARTNLDPLIVSSKLPWIDCGSDGMLGHIQPVVPFLTETYCSQRDMPLQDQPMDGITMRPNHYMVANWATLACIDREFDSVAHLVNAYLDNPSCYDHNADTLEKVRLFLSKRETTIEDCIQFGRALFEACFVLNTKTLMQAFPINCKTHSGEWFWKAERRPTIPVEYDAGDEDHVEFVASAAYLKGFMTGVIDENSKPPNWNEIKDSIREATRHTTYPDLDALPKVTPTVATVVAIKSQMPQVDSLKHWRMKYVKPNYRDHSGFHVDLAVAACLIRCRALAISAEPRSYWLKFLTSSTPSLISTSATVAGLGCLELIKLAHSTYAPKPLQSTFLNLHTGDIIPSEPAKPETMTFAGASFNIWSSIEIHGKGMTVLDILTHFLTNYQIEVEIISVGPSLIYGAFAGTYKQRLNMLLTEAVSQGTGKPLSDYRGRFELDIVAVDSLTGEDINDIPSIVVFYE